MAIDYLNFHNCVSATFYVNMLYLNVSLGYFGTRRTGQEVKRKWSDLKSRVKAKAASLAIETDKDDGTLTLKLTPNEERVLAIISRDLEDQSPRYESTAHGSKWPSVKVFSFHVRTFCIFFLTLLNSRFLSFSVFCIEF